MTYYQLVQRDIDGEETIYSPVSENCERNHEAELKVYPNPNSGVFKVELYSNNNGIYNLQLLDVNGRVISSKSHSLEKGTNTIMISEHLVKGFYIIKLTNDSKEVKSAKLIVE